METVDVYGGVKSGKRLPSGKLLDYAEGMHAHSGRNDAYVIKVCDHHGKALPLPDISRRVARFLDFARSHQDMHFVLLGELACGDKMYDPEDIAPMFSECPANVMLCDSFAALLSPEKSLNRKPRL